MLSRDISDEVYGVSQFPSRDVPNPKPFVSILALDTQDLIDPAYLHILYGMSKVCYTLRLTHTLLRCKP